MPWRHPDSCITDRVPTNFNQNHVDRLKAYIVKLGDILERVLVRSGISRVWHNPMCDLVLRRSNNTVMSIYDFLCMPSLDKVMVREEPHGLDTYILDRVVDRTTSPAPAGTAIPSAFLEEIAVTRPDLKTRSSKKGSGAGSSRQATRDGVKQTDDGTLYDDDQRDGPEFAMEDIESLNDVSQDKEVEPHGELSRGVRRNTRAGFRDEDASPRPQEAAPALDGQPLDADVDADEIAIDAIFFLLSGGLTTSPILMKKVLEKRELYKDPKVCRTTLNRFPTPAGTHRLRELSSVKFSDSMSMLQCQLITYWSMLNARYDHSLRNIERLAN
ncbi:hypothetical protein Tco_1510876 [Tanacetum coccineum]